MSINNISGNSINQTNNQLNKVNRNNSPEAVRLANARENSATAPSDQDNLTITGTAAKLKQLEDSIAQLPIVDMQRVEDLQQAINNGSYTINPEKIAEKLIDMEFALSRS